MRTLLVFCLSLFILSCSTSVEPIDYGHDECHFCQMKIMDPRFGSEVITDKGRIYKFDSTECLLHYLRESTTMHDFVLVTDYERPNTLIGADSAVYLVSEKMPSPMGGNLNAFSDDERARHYHKENGGTVFQWSEIQDEYARK